MRAEDVRPTVPSTSPSRPGSGLLVRLGWMVGGTLTMLITGLVIMSSPAWTYGARDLVFWGGALLAITLRYIDIHRYGGETSRGDPATMGHFARYAAGVVGVGLALWTMAQSVHL